MVVGLMLERHRPAERFGPATVTSVCPSTRLKPRATPLAYPEHSSDVLASSKLFRLPLSVKVYSTPPAQHAISSPSAWTSWLHSVYQPSVYPSLG